MLVYKIKEFQEDAKQENLDIEAEGIKKEDIKDE